jgi:hypothetical protein
MRLVALFCTLGGIAAAQTQQPVEATASVNPAGGATIRVKNHYTAPLVAFVFIYTLRDAQSTVYSATTGYYDSAIDPVQQHAIPPGEEVKLPYYAGNRGMVPVINVAGVLFADGFTQGHKDMVQTISERRNYALVTLNRSIADLKQAVKENATRDQLIGRMQGAMNQDRMGSGNNDMANIILTIRNQVFMDMVNARNPDGTPMPIEKFLPVEIENLTHRREALLPK